ncbi:MAG: hypothetical protein ACREPM_06310, partial [Gemmatimonadaceae bacterium]
MNYMHRTPRSRAAFVATLWLLATPALALAQAKKALSVEDYSRWRAIGAQALSGDGKWVTYVLSQTNTAPAEAKPVLHLLRLDTNADLEIANASAPAFSSDSKWIAYQIDPASTGRGGRGGRGGGGGGGGGG